MNEATLPLRLVENILIQHVAHETLLYDEQRHLAFCLNRTSAAVWELCDGNHSVSHIAASLALKFRQPVSEEVVRLAIQQLQFDGLLHPTPSTSRDIVLSRRSLVGQMSVGMALMLPVIASIAAPRAAQAYSGCVNCTSARPSNNRRPDGVER